MNIRLPEILITVLLAAGFTAVGEVVLRRRSCNAVSWNESFLTGMGISAAALFPLSLLFPHGALRAELALMSLALLVTLSRRLRAGPPPPTPPGSARRDPIALLIFGAIVLVFVTFAALDLRYNLAWDAFQIWASKTQLLFSQGGLGRAWYPGDTYELRHVSYPSLIPLYEALLALVRARFDFDSFKPVFLPFYVSMLLATYGAARSVLPARHALAAALLVALLPLLSAQHAAGGYADMPEAAFVAGVACAALRSGARRDALPWLIGGLTTVKAEGIILALVASGAVILCWLIERPGGIGPRLRSNMGAIAVVAAFLGLRFSYIRWVGVPDSVYGPLDGPHIAEALRRIPQVARLCLVKMLSPRRWGLFWPAFFLSALVLAVRGTAREKSLALAATAATVILATVFLFTSWPLELHVEQAYPRLLAQLAPAAAAAILIGFHRAHPTAVAAASPPQSPWDTRG